LLIFVGKKNSLASAMLGFLALGLGKMNPFEINLKFIMIVIEHCNTLFWVIVDELFGSF
jgi:hypothetical protein